MIVIGSNSEVAQAFVEVALAAGERYRKIFLLSSNPESAAKFAAHIQVKFLQDSEIIPLNLEEKIDFATLENADSELVFCAAGYLGESTEDALYDNKNTEKIITVNYSALIPVLNFFAEKMERKRSGTIIALSSVAGDRGRQSNFIYGSAKAGFTAYLSGLRNFLFAKKVHVMTVKPGFMDTKMTEGLPLNKNLTATPKQAAKTIYQAYKNKRNTVYVLPIWRFIMLIIKNIPENIFKKLKL